MPRIINAYDGNSAIGDSLAKLGEAIYGDQAKNEVYRQKAFGAKRENDNIPLLADAVASGDRNAIAKYGVLSNKTGQDTGDFNRLGVSNHATGVDDPNLALATMGAGGAFNSTAPGQGRQLQNAITTTGMNNASAERIGAGNNATSITVGKNNNDTQRDIALTTDGRTLVPVDNGDGTSHYETKSNAGAGNMAVPATKEGVLGNMLRRYATQSGPTTADAGAPAAPQGNPFANIPPQVQHVLGVGMPDQSLIEPRSGMTGISRDGGQTVILPNGATIPATGFQPVGQDAALGQARDNNVRTGASKPLVVGDPAKSKAAADAAATTGVWPALQSGANKEVGATLGPGVIKAVGGSPEIAAPVQRARSDQDIRNNQARTVLLGAPGRQTVQAQKWVNDLLPQGDVLSNPATEAAKIPTIVNALKGDHEQLRLVAIDPNTLPAERVKVTQQMHQIENTIRMFTDPAPPTAGAQAAPAGPPTPPISGPQGAAPAQGPTKMMINAKGEKIGLVNNQWVPIP